MITNQRASEAFSDLVERNRVWMVSRSSRRFVEIEDYPEDYFASRSKCEMLAFEQNLGIRMYVFQELSDGPPRTEINCTYENNQYGILPAGARSIAEAVKPTE